MHRLSAGLLIALATLILPGLPAAADSFGIRIGDGCGTSFSWRSNSSHHHGHYSGRYSGSSCRVFVPTFRSRSYYYVSSPWVYEARPTYSTVETYADVYQRQREYANSYTTDAAPTTEPVPPSVDRLAAAWEDLEAGRTQQAFSGFSDYCAANPTEAQCRVGYALAAALADNHRAAVWAMRQAAVMNAEQISFLPISETLGGSLQRLAVYYADLAATPQRNPDALFMLAALRLAQHDLDRAHAAILRAWEDGDRKLSTASLKQVISAAVAQEIN